MPATVVCNLCVGQKLLINLKITITLLSSAPLAARVQQLLKPFFFFIVNNCDSRQIFKKLEDSTSSMSVLLLNWRLM